MMSRLAIYFRGGVRTGAMGAIAPVNFEDFHKLSTEKEILKIGQDLTKLGPNV